MMNQYKIDPAHSSAQFSIRHMMISNVRGSFSGVHGTVNFDPANPAGTTLEASIEVATLNTQDAARDSHVKSPDFLDVAQFPTMTFKSTAVQSTGDGELSVTGDLTLRGVTRPVTLTVEGPSAASKDPWGNTRIGASATTKIKRSDFGLSYNAVLETGGVLLGDDLKITLDVSLIQA